MMTRKVVISTGNTKVGKIANVSLLPVDGCRHKAPCRNGGCYAIKLARRPSVNKAWSGNLELASKRQGDYFLQIYQYLLENSPSHFRWHVAGDILDLSYFHHMCLLAMEFPQTKFLCFTKRHKLVHRVTHIPENLSIVLSVWPKHPIYNERLFPMAFLDDESDKRIPIDAVKCSGKCTDCFACWEMNRGKGQSVRFRRH